MTEMTDYKSSPYTIHAESTPIGLRWVVRRQDGVRVSSWRSQRSADRDVRFRLALAEKLAGQR